MLISHPMCRMSELQSRIKITWHTADCATTKESAFTRSLGSMLSLGTSRSLQHQARANSPETDRKCNATLSPCLDKVLTQRVEEVAWAYT